jgi:hypothetical protein
VRGRQGAASARCHRLPQTGLRRGIRGPMHPLKQHLASALRRLAYRIDQADVMSAAFHKMTVRKTSEYVLRTERYIVALEAKTNDQILAHLRKKHDRHDTRHFVEAQGEKHNFERHTGRCSKCGIDDPNDADGSFVACTKPSRDWPFTTPTPCRGPRSGRHPLLHDAVWAFGHGRVQVRDARADRDGCSLRGSLEGCDGDEFRAEELHRVLALRARLWPGSRHEVRLRAAHQARS